MDIVLFSMAYPVTALGPGSRVVLWVSGCDKRCRGCISPEMQPRDAGKAVPVDVLLRRILELDTLVDGITISGGEPFDQAPALAELLSALRTDRPAWNVLIYTGYLIEEIKEDGSGWAKLLDCADILIDGPYRRRIPREHPLTGSGNQRVHYLTERGQSLKPRVDATPAEHVNLGLGAGSLDMIIGVTETTTRDEVCETFHAEPHTRRVRRRERRRPRTQRRESQAL
jgi:anaerobic ribonucleoside-triphosphate reductase activating protein